MIARVTESGFLKAPDPGESEEAYVGAMLNRLTDAIIDALKLESRSIPAPVARLLIATSEARLYGFILAVLNTDEAQNSESG